MSEVAERRSAEPVKDRRRELRVSEGEDELWRRAAEMAGLSVSDFMRSAVSEAAERLVSAAQVSGADEGQQPGIPEYRWGS